MTVDFGWPWWAFTAIAVGVAAVSALLFLNVRERFPRGVFATLLAEGVVIAALAPAMMSASPSVMTAGDFARQADANCRALDGQLAPLGNPKTLPGIARKLDVVVPAVSMALRAQAALRPPVGEQRVASQWMKEMTRYRDGLSSMRADAHAGDGAALAKANKRVGLLGGANARLSKQLGLSYCFQQ